MTFSDVSLIVTLAVAVIVVIRGPDWLRWYFLVSGAALVVVFGAAVLLAAAA